MSADTCKCLRACSDVNAPAEVTQMGVARCQRKIIVVVRIHWSRSRSCHKLCITPFSQVQLSLAGKVARLTPKSFSFQSWMLAFPVKGKAPAVWGPSEYPGIYCCMDPHCKIGISPKKT